MIDIESIKTIATEDLEINWSSKTVLELITRLEAAEQDAAKFRIVFGEMRNMRVDQITEEMILETMKEAND